MAAQAREALLELGFENDKVNKAVKHFGSRIDISEAVEWILNDCPGYVDYAPPAHQAPHPSSNTQVVPYVGSQQDSGQSAPYSQAQQNDNSGWISAYQEQPPAHLSDNDVASSILALKDSRNATGSQVQQNRNRSDSLVTQPPEDNPWEVKPGDLDRPYTKIPLEPPTEDVPHSQYAATMDQNRMPTIDLTNADGNMGTSAPRASPIDPALRSNSNLTPSGDGDADLERAIALSLAESNKAAASSDMSRTGSLSRARQQEEDDYNQALSQSMLFADQQASTSSLKEQDPLDTRIRSDPDTPVVVSSPSSFLAYLPSMMHTFYANPLFRKVILELEMDYVQTPSFEKYGGDAPVLTRSLLQPSAPDCVVKLAALQRLFLFMSHSRRAKTGLTDIMDAYGIKIPNGARDRNPLSDMKALHDSISQAWLQYVQMWLEDQVSKGTMSTETASETSEQARSLIFSRGISLPDITESVLNTDPEPAFFSEANPALQWSSCAAIQSIPPELNDTYSALDEYFGHADRTAFIVKPGKALYIYNHRLAQSTPVIPAIGPPPPPYSMLSQAEEIPASFKVEPELYLDRYDWKNRKEVMEVRRQIRASQEQLAKLLMQRERLVASSKPGKQLVTPLSVSDKKDSDESTNVVAADAKSVLQLAIAKLEELSATIQDPDREKSQNSLIEKLKAIVALLQEQIHNVDHEIAQIRKQISKTREFDKKEIGPYQLRTVIMWNGFMGRDSIYTYVQSGTATAEIDGSPLKNPKWWKVAGDGVFEVSKDIVLNDVTGIHMLGGGSIAQSYVVAQEGEEEVTAGSIPEQLLQAIEADNAAYLAEVGKSTPVPPADATSAATDGQGTAVAPTETKDEIMQTDEETNNKATTAQANTVTLHLRGGASRRRMSVTSDTGSIASTSRVRLDDWDDDDDASDEFLETVELGFPVKMKKGFKVVKDVGKIGGKPTWLDPAIPLKPDMVTCGICQSRMEYLLQMNCPLDELPQAIYRTFYVYTCRRASCLKNATSQGVKVYRVQLPANNAYYDLQEEAAQSKAQKFKDKQYAELCATCKMKHDDPCPSKPWNEWLVETGAEDVEEEDEAPISTDDVEERIAKATLYSEGITGEEPAEPDTRTAVDTAFLKFQERLHNEPDQVLRYYYRDKDAEPLWVSDEKRSRPKGIPKCACGAERKVEFQIMPPILSILGVNDLERDSLDFGTIIVYTCTESCTVSKIPLESVFEGELAGFTPPSGWSEEIGFVQNFTEQGVRFQCGR